VCCRSQRIAQEDNIKDFKVYASWVFGFMKRNNLSVRFSTTFSEMEAEEIPKKVLKAIDSFNVESNEEFLGFE
jgi:hypothetical protein